MHLHPNTGRHFKPEERMKHIDFGGQRFKVQASEANVWVCREAILYVVLVYIKGICICQISTKNLSFLENYMTDRLTDEQQEN